MGAYGQTHCYEVEKVETLRYELFFLLSNIKPVLNYMLRGMSRSLIFSKQFLFFGKSLILPLRSPVQGPFLEGPEKP